MTEQIARNVGPSKIDIAYERLGPAEGPPLLLIMGGGAQMVAWPDGFCAELVARGLQVIRFDNRDVGHSTHWRQSAPAPEGGAGHDGKPGAAYRLEDMAADAVGLLDSLGIPAAHVAGMSLGGQIAQVMAADHPQRVLSLVSMSSWTGARSSGQPAKETMPIFELPPPTTRAEAVDQALVVARAIGSPGFPMDEAAVREMAGLSFDRDPDVEGPGRQAQAATASGDRTTHLVAVRAPTLVLHGAADRMVDVSGGIATAAAIPGARLETIEGMGHDLPRALWSMLADLISAHVERSAREQHNPDTLHTLGIKRRRGVPVNRRPLASPVMG